MWEFLFLHKTAGVAMVPYPNSPKSPYFHDCLNWLLDNQLDDDKQSILVAGLHYIESNFALVTKKNEASPSGFDIIFPADPTAHGGGGSKESKTSTAHSGTWWQLTELATAAALAVMTHDDWQQLYGRIATRRLQQRRTPQPQMRPTSLTTTVSVSFFFYHHGSDDIRWQR
ncbi:unnamed protein product [Lactuca virosa]|uniref:Uncharacterized protein n=1 Tax=Lactuca virosa TaxID=75947 RepID=A0AAU9PNW6_9ASTR|nr:unnamed protein product [Lactuca virosa]